MKQIDSYKFEIGLTDNILDQMIGYAHTDQQVIDQTSDSKRFSSLESAQKWLKKSRKYFFALSPIENENELAGIIWVEEKKLPKHLKAKYPNCNWTFGIRVYEKFRGQKLSKPFMEHAFKEFWKLEPNTDVWLTTKSTNKVAMSIYEKFGFKKIGEYNNKAYFILAAD